MSGSSLFAAVLGAFLLLASIGGIAEHKGGAAIELAAAIALLVYASMARAKRKKTAAVLEAAIFHGQAPAPPEHPVVTSRFGMALVILVGAIVIAIVAGIIQGDSPASPPASATATAAETLQAKQEKAASDRFDTAFGGAVLLMKAMRDPDSFRVSYVRVTEGDQTVCYRYRAQNGFGGMNESSAVVYAGGFVDESESQTRLLDVWSAHCTGAGYNMTDKVATGLQEYRTMHPD